MKGELLVRKVMDIKVHVHLIMTKHEVLLLRTWIKGKLSLSMQTPQSNTARELLETLDKFDITQAMPVPEHPEPQQRYCTSCRKLITTEPIMHLGNPYCEDCAIHVLHFEL